MRNRFAVLTLAGLMAFGAVACTDDGAGTGTDVEAPAIDPAADPAAPAADPALEDPALEPTE